MFYDLKIKSFLTQMSAMMNIFIFGANVEFHLFALTYMNSNRLKKNQFNKTKIKITISNSET